ncbi:MAG: arginase family protein [Candidatus Omnitrophota bacterium]
MLDKGLRILNFDNSIVAQRKLFSEYLTKVVDFTGLANCARLFMPSGVRSKILRDLGDDGKNYPCFLGSGDFHHISEVLTSRINEEACLIVFDFHPDWDLFSPRFACGSWVNQALKNKFIVKCVLIGPGSEDLSFPALQTANLGALSSGRLEIYPYRKKPSRVYFRGLRQSQSIVVRKGIFSDQIIWDQLENKDLAGFFLQLIRRLPTNKVYVSIDKDCLRADYALTNWEEGFLSLEQLLATLRLIRHNLDIVGLDVTGDYSPPRIAGRIKAAISKFDHPKHPSADNCLPSLITSVNERVNLQLLQEVFS